MGEAECTSENIFIHQRQCVGEEEPINMYFTLLSSLFLFVPLLFAKVMEQVLHQDCRSIPYSTQESVEVFNII